MLLVYAVIAGLIAGSIRAATHKSIIQVPEFAHSWLVFVAVIPQLIAFEIPSTSSWIPDSFARIILVGTQIVLLAFVWVNRKSPAVWLLGVGLGLNLLVIVLNGGLMPISPEAASNVYPAISVEEWKIGSRLGTGKDIILHEWDTNLPYLADRFHLPGWIPYRVAFSLGDVFIALGAFRVLWHAGQIPGYRPEVAKTQFSS